MSVPHRHPAAWTRRGLLQRDSYTCAYCGKHRTPREVTIDHVLPISRGGQSTWGNTVTACAQCNQLKADRTPAEAGLKLLIEPRLPHTRGSRIRGQVPAAWNLWGVR